jgi:hypothetical protein
MPFAHRIHVMAGAANALHSAGDRRRRFNLDHQIDRAHIDAQFQRRRGAERANLPRLQLLFNDRALRRGQRAMMRARDGLAGQLIQRAGQPLGHLAAVHKQNCRVARANDFEQARMNRIPDGNRLGLAKPDRWADSSCSPRCAMSSTGTSMRSFKRLGALALTMVTGR